MRRLPRNGIFGKKKTHRQSFLLFLDCFKVNQMGFEQVFDNLSV